MIGERTAEEIKISIGSANVNSKETKMNIRGRDLVSGLPKIIEINSKEVYKAMEDQIYSILDAIKSTLENTPPELAADIMEQGITLTGGGALLEGLDKLIVAETGMPVNIAENPLDCVAMGTGKALESIEVFKKILPNKKRTK